VAITVAIARRDRDIATQRGGLAWASRVEEAREDDPSAFTSAHTNGVPRTPTVRSAENHESNDTSFPRRVTSIRVSAARIT